MIDLIKELIPHSPKIGLYVDPHIPPRKLRNAIDDYAPNWDPSDVVALFDVTLLGGARDGMLLATDRVVFQNTNFEEPQEIRYSDIVEVGVRRAPFKGTRIVLHVNRGRATFETELNVSAKPRVAEYLRRFFEEAMLRPEGGESVATDWARVLSVLQSLNDEGYLTDRDLQRIVNIIRD